MTVRVTESCTACGACLITCPTAALVAGPGRPAVRDDRCTDCLACVEVCPADALTPVPGGLTPRPGPAPAGRPSVKAALLEAEPSLFVHLCSVCGHK
jgi:ferredoxin